ncbi:hypothetical protein GW17_00011382 [Ensete ventricosum]|nr:hypothetical protein GW17_00011382 [Ensete ventricosum]
MPSTAPVAPSASPSTDPLSPSPPSLTMPSYASISCPQQSLVDLLRRAAIYHCTTLLPIATYYLLFSAVTSAPLFSMTIFKPLPFLHHRRCFPSPNHVNSAPISRQHHSASPAIMLLLLTPHRRCPSLLAASISARGTIAIAFLFNSIVVKRRQILSFD